MASTPDGSAPYGVPTQNESTHALAQTTRALELVLSLLEAGAASLQRELAERVVGLWGGGRCAVGAKIEDEHL